MITVNGAAGGIHQALHSAVPGRHQHIQEAGDVVRMKVGGVCDRPRHGAQGRLVQHVIHSLACALARVRVPYVTIHLPEILPLVGTNQFPHLLQIVAGTRRVIIQSHHPLVQTEERLQQVGANESGHTGDQPNLRLGRHLFFQVFVSAHVKSLHQAFQTCPGRVLMSPMALRVSRMHCAHSASSW